MKKNCVLLFCIVFFLVSAISVECHNQTFNVLDFGAVGDGSTDDTQRMEYENSQMKSKWEASLFIDAKVAFGFELNSQDEEYNLQRMEYENSQMKSKWEASLFIDAKVAFGFELNRIGGNLTAPSHPSKWKCDGSNCRQWIGFTEINGLYIYGSGTINAQGTKWWGSSNVNHTRKYHGSKPTGFVIAHSNHVHISDLTFIDSPQMHMALERSTWVYVYNLTITAPGDSPNTDGIHIQHSTHVFISQTHIGTGDDCISIGDGSSYLNISMITCGPGLA
ncbi:unnamed protein product [Camellia sinensis]